MFTEVLSTINGCLSHKWSTAGSELSLPFLQKSCIFSLLKIPLLLFCFSFIIFINNYFVFSLSPLLLLHFSACHLSFSYNSQRQKALYLKIILEIIKFSISSLNNNVSKQGNFLKFLNSFLFLFGSFFVEKVISFLFFFLESYSRLFIYSHFLVFSFFNF